MTVPEAEIYYACPVCGFRGLTDPPKDFEICPCCGTEFGNHDYERSHEELRADWHKKGMPWFSLYQKPPMDWNPVLQLREKADDD